MSQFEEALKAANISITKYNPTKHRPITTNIGGTVTLDKFSKIVSEKLGANAVGFPEVFAAVHDLSKMNEMVEEYVKINNIGDGSKPAPTADIPDDMKNLQLMYDITAKGRLDKFFLINKNDVISQVSGEAYIDVHQMKYADAVAQAIKVVPRYLPRRKRGVIQGIGADMEPETIFNTYGYPVWKGFRNPQRLPNTMPVLFDKLVKHMFPLKIEQEYFYSWLHASLFDRAFVFLILCGPPGIGKNRIKIVMRALHGHVNTVDGKKSSLVDKFNSQFSESTLSWFDELKYDFDMENTMKELQNDSISIERKGVDATRASAIHSSIVISNNKPRDNYIAFDSRKFVPLKLSDNRLEDSMTPAEIDELTRKVSDPTSPDFDVAFIAQIAKWIKTKGKSKKWPNLEYKGPMFWALAHTSMTRWQKKAVVTVLDPASKVQRMGYDQATGRFLWSSVNAVMTKKNGDRSLTFPDYSSVQAFFEAFKDSKGKKAFETEYIEGENIFGDFWVKNIIKNTQITTETTIEEQRRIQNDGRKETDLDDL